MDTDTESTSVSTRMKNARSGSKCVYSLLVPQLYPSIPTGEQAGVTTGAGENTSPQIHMRKHATYGTLQQGKQQQCKFKPQGVTTAGCSSLGKRKCR